ncbi:efflux transporter periplasmic adaptor subunit [Bradyrhizobium sp. WD16]|nr:HlyD family efflux transporter periplasmic adaptor subunit [Bradyrhizobium sp. WD16]UTD27541.1 efflux transporter periplasmic adaptor subunit [Bradyrhizobium sp. WD16]
MRMSWTGVVGVGIAIAAVAAVIWALRPQPVKVETARATRGRFIATVNEDGKTRVRERYVVAAPLAGGMARIGLKVGDRLRDGDRVTTITPSPVPLLDARSRREADERLGAAEATRERTQAAVQRADAQLAQARTDLDRTRDLAARGVATTQALERAELALRVADRDARAAQFQDHAAEHEVSQARALLGRYDRGGDAAAGRWDVTAPVAGAVLKVFQESETIVSPGTPLLEIGDPSDLEIVIDVLSSEAVEISPGAQVTIEAWGGPQPLAGRVRRIEPAGFTKISTLGVEEQRVNVIIDVTSSAEARGGLGDGYRVEARITVFEKDDALIVPVGALFRTGPQWQVYLVQGGRVELRNVELVRRSGRFAAIAAGLDEGDEVVVYPGDRVRPGSAVARLRD